jgi:hypothetical protein
MNEYTEDIVWITEYTSDGVPYQTISVQYLYACIRNAIASLDDDDVITFTVRDSTLWFETHNNGGILVDAHIGTSQACGLMRYLNGVRRWPNRDDNFVVTQGITITRNELIDLMTSDHTR